MTTEQPAAEPYSGIQLSVEIVELVRARANEHQLDPMVFIGALEIAQTLVSNSLLAQMSEGANPEEPGDAELQSQN